MRGRSSTPFAFRRGRVKSPFKLSSTSTRSCHGLVVASVRDVEEEVAVPTTSRTSPLGIQLIPQSLHEQLFPRKPQNPSSTTNNQPDLISQAKTHLSSHGLLGRPSSSTTDVEFRLPPLHGPSLDAHFRQIAEDQTRPYKEALVDLSASSIPPPPKQWRFTAGWTKYPAIYAATAEPVSVSHPDGEALVFDVEVLVGENQAPTLAVAASTTNWFSWCAEKLVGDEAEENTVGNDVRSSL